ncbi:hypothetical protein MRS44_018353 [Fusarium solani]|uniref:uncharacterized protein n=1 Tax=Fusarium solani TaxID=169388 RepID=UPI0032C46F00|nr:hypothetical protein MRS44_018353 [Fusarium solani]
MTQVSAKSRQAAARAARAYLAGAGFTKTTRRSPSRPYSIEDVARLHNANKPLTVKYLYLLKAGKPLPSEKKRPAKGGRPGALTAAEERALIEFIRSVENCAFQVTEAYILNYACFLRKHRVGVSAAPVSSAWTRRFKKRHPEIQCTKPKVKEITRAGAELDIERMDLWYDNLEMTMKEKDIVPRNFWNFDESPLKIGWVDDCPRIYSIRKRKKSRPVSFQPGNKESFTAVDAISAAGLAIPSFLIFQAKSLLEEYAFANIDDEVVLTHTETGSNNHHRAFQWIQHFNRHSFSRSSDFDGFTIETWFGYNADLTRTSWTEDIAFRASKMTRKSAPVHRLLLMDGFSAHEDPDFLWYCKMFDITAFQLPSHTSHLTQPLDVGVYQHLKKEQHNALTDFIIGGGLRMTRFEFLNMWDRMYRAAFLSCHIYTGFQKSGLWPPNREVVLASLRQAAKDIEEPMFPKLIHPVTPRKAKKDLASIRHKFTDFSSPTRAKIEHAEAALDYAIVAKLSHQRLVSLQRERIRIHALRTHTLRRVPNPTDSALSFAEIRERVTDRAHDDWIKEFKRQTKDQNAWMQELREQESTRGNPTTPALRGRAAARAKAARALEEAQRLEEQRRALLTNEELEAQERFYLEWLQADEERRSLLYTTSPKSLVDSIPEIDTWRDEQTARREAVEAAAGAEDVIVVQDLPSSPGDFLSVESSPELPPLPDDESMDEDEVEIFTQPRVEGTTAVILNISQRPFAIVRDVEDDPQLHEVNYGGWGYNRMPTRYDDAPEGGEIEATPGVRIAAPGSQRRNRRPAQVGYNTTRSK